jgi:hypothetical protein
LRHYVDTTGVDDRLDGRRVDQVLISRALGLVSAGSELTFIEPSEHAGLLRREQM